MASASSGDFFTPCSRLFQVGARPPYVLNVTQTSALNMRHAREIPFGLVKINVRVLFRLSDESVSLTRGVLRQDTRNAKKQYFRGTDKIFFDCQRGFVIKPPLTLKIAPKMCHAGKISCGLINMKFGFV